MTDARYSGDIEVRYFLGADLIAMRFETSTPLQGEVETLDGVECLVETRAVRFSDADRCEALEVQVQSLC